MEAPAGSTALGVCASVLRPDCVREGSRPGPDCSRPLLTRALPASSTGRGGFAGREKRGALLVTVAGARQNHGMAGISGADLWVVDRLARLGTRIGARYGKKTEWAFAFAVLILIWRPYMRLRDRFANPNDKRSS